VLQATKIKQLNFQLLSVAGCYRQTSSVSGLSTNCLLLFQVKTQIGKLCRR